MLRIHDKLALALLPVPETPRAMIARRLQHLAVLVVALLLAGCGGEPPPPDYSKPNYDHLVALNLMVGRVDIDASWAPRGAGRRVEFLAPVTPRDALRRMAEDRLVAVGTTGHVVFTIEDASIVRGARHYEGALAARLELLDDEGKQLGKVGVRVLQLRPVGEESAAAVRDDLYAFVRDLMAEMNVELEFQTRRALRDFLQVTRPTAPETGPVETQSLDAPPKP